MKNRKEKIFGNNIDDVVLRELSAISELELTANYLIPLFKAIGFYKVDYYGGQNEGGKDIICWRTDEIGKIELAVAQVKKYKPSAKSSGDSTFCEVVHQLEQAVEKKVPDVSGLEYFPSIIYFITPYQIQTRALESRFEGYKALCPKRVKIIDGIDLLNLLKDKTPLLINQLVGNDLLVKITENNISNKELLRALNYNSDIDIASFYSDLDFGIGRMSTKFFFLLNFKPQKLPVHCYIEEWNELKYIHEIVKGFFCINMFYEDIDVIEARYMIEKRLHNKEKAKVKKDTRNELQEPEFFFDLNGYVLAERLLEKQKWLSLRDVTGISVNNTKKLIEECLVLYKKTDIFLSNKYIANALGFAENTINAQPENITKLNIPIHKVFDTRMNIFLLGEAGAGKTTTLQAYAKTKSNVTNAGEFCIYWPLARLVNNRTSAKGPVSNVDELLNLMVADLFKKGITLDMPGFIRLLDNKMVSILFDGLDEVVNKEVWVIKGIVEFSERYPKVQLIVSSRMSGKYIKEIPFFGITLLPFTNRQRDDFIKAWFVNRRNDKAAELIKHLNVIKELSAIVRLPLLATILCVLADFDIPLPRTEAKLYEERLKLLLGHYDVHKQTKRIESHSETLDVIGRKIAYNYHLKGIRFADKSQIYKLLKNDLLGLYSKEQIALSIDELIDPCNILFPMSDGAYSFGHLRYQEHLAAKELCLNRGIDIFPLLSNIWWKGVLILFSQMTDNINFIMNAINSSKKVYQYDDVIRDTIISMIKVRPAHEKEDLIIKFPIINSF